MDDGSSKLLTLYMLLRAAERMTELGTSRPQFDTLLVGPTVGRRLERMFEEGKPVADATPFPTTMFGFRVVKSPSQEALREPRWPEGCIRSQPWWLSDEGWAKHRQWMGDTFGWNDVSYLMNTSQALKLVT